MTVRYLAFPRSGPQGPGSRELRAVWCAEERRAAMDIAQGVRAGALGDGTCAAAGALERGFLTGKEFGVQGTPAIILADGRMLAGYKPTSELVALLGLAPGRPAAGRGISP